MYVHALFHKCLWTLASLVAILLTSPLQALSSQAEQSSQPAQAVESAPPQAENPGMVLLAQHLFTQLPSTLSPQQKAAAMSILTAAGPRIFAAQARVAAILSKLRELSFSAQFQTDHFFVLGQELVVSRDALRNELRQVSEELEKGIGVNPHWDVPRSCAMPQTVQGSTVHKN